MLYNHDVIGLQQNRSGLYNTHNRARMALWDVQYINSRLTQTSGFNTLHPSFVFFFLELNGMSKMKGERDLNTG